MAKYNYTKTEYEKICDELLLNDEMKEILLMKIKEYSITKMSFELNMSESAIKRRLAKLNRKINELK